MTEQEKKVYEVLDRLEIRYRRHTHPPVYTVEEAERHWRDVEGAHCKNIFVRNQKGNRHFLVILEHKKTVDLKSLAQRLGQSRFSFASPERLMRFLGLEPGSVSPFGLINDTEKEVRVVIDTDLERADIVNFHPNVNTATVGISLADFRRFLDRCGQDVRFLKL